MAGSMSRVYGALAGILFIISVSILSLPFFFGIAISSLMILLSSAMFEGGVLFLILRKSSDFPHYGYKITMNVITWFIVIYFILNLLIDFSSSTKFPSEIGSIISDSFLLLPFTGLISSIVPFVYALSAVNEPMTSALDAYLFLMGVPALNAYRKGRMLLKRPVNGNRRKESEIILPISEGNFVLEEKSIKRLRIK